MIADRFSPNLTSAGAAGLWDAYDLKGPTAKAVLYVFKSNLVKIHFCHCSFGVMWELCSQCCSHRTLQTYGYLIRLANSPEGLVAGTATIRFVFISKSSPDVSGPYSCMTKTTFNDGDNDNRDNSDCDDDNRDDSDRDDDNRDDSDRDDDNRYNCDRDDVNRDNSDRDDDNRNNSDCDNSDCDNGDRDNSDCDDDNCDNSDCDDDNRDNKDRDSSDRDNSDRDNGDRSETSCYS